MLVVFSREQPFQPELFKLTLMIGFPTSDKRILEHFGFKLCRRWAKIFGLTKSTGNVFSNRRDKKFNLQNWLIPIEQESKYLKINIQG